MDHDRRTVFCGGKLVTPPTAPDGEMPGCLFSKKRFISCEEIGILLPNNQRQHRTLHTQKDVLPYALC